MNPQTFELLPFLSLLGVALLAGGFGSLVGIGGGIILVPVLTLVFHVPMHAAIGASLVSVIATSLVSSITYLKRRLVNLDLGLLLEIPTATGAIAGGLLAARLPAPPLQAIFGGVAILFAYLMMRRSSSPAEATGEEAGEVRNLGAGLAISSTAGMMSGLLGVGGGVVKIPIMHLVMGLPIRVAAATSAFMIGITASTSAVIYYGNGMINPVLTAPCTLGVLIGARLGSRLSSRFHPAILQRILALLLAYLGVTMAVRGLFGGGA